MKVIGEIVNKLTFTIHNPAHILDVQDFLQNLSASEQIVLTLRIVHDLPFRDIAAVVGIWDSDPYPDKVLNKMSLY